MKNPKESPGLPEDTIPSLTDSREIPRHGFRGNQLGAAQVFSPGALTVAVSREAGSRGSTISTRAGAKLGWPVYGQELLEFMAQEDASDRVDPPLVPGGQRWIEDRLEALLRRENSHRHPSMMKLARVVLGLAARGEVILVGRGAGLLLPPETTLNVRIVAPLGDRVAYLGQWLRLTDDEAADQVRQRDAKRAEYLASHFHRHSHELCDYDLILNSTSLGEGMCATLIAASARSKNAALMNSGSNPDLGD